MTLDPSLEKLRRSGLWRALTSVPRKYTLFSRETHFRESWRLAEEILGRSALLKLQRIAVLVLKPDAIVGRKGQACFAYMRHHGFSPLAAFPVRYNRLNTREIWRFQWNIATLDRLTLGDIVHGMSPGLLVIFVDNASEDGIPASVRLAGLKGSSLPWERQPHHLRSQLGSLNRILVLIHCSDEPIDIVRELGILFGPVVLKAVYRDIDKALSANRPRVTDDLLVKLEASCPEGQLSVSGAANELRESIRNQIGRTFNSAATRVIAAVDAAERGTVLNWTEWSEDLRLARLNVSSWALIVVGSHYVRHDVPGARCIISESGRERWLGGYGLRVYA